METKNSQESVDEMLADYMNDQAEKSDENKLIEGEMIEVRDDELYSETVVINEKSVFELPFFIHKHTKIPLKVVQSIFWVLVIVFFAISGYLGYGLFEQYQQREEFKTQPHPLTNYIP